MSYPGWNPIRVTITTPCTTGWGNDVQNNLKSLLHDAYDTKGSVSTLKKFISVSMNTSGTLKASAISHSALYNVLADQHHNKLHNIEHVNGIDDVPIVTTTRRGLVSPALAERLADIASGATYNAWSQGSYIGVGITTSKYISLGYRPKWVVVHNNLERSAEVIDGATFAFRHQLNNHARPKASTYLRITITGFSVVSTLNRSTTANKNYYYFAVRGA